MKMIRKILLCAGTGLLLSTGSLQSVPGGIFHMDTAYGAESSIIETMSIKFDTTFGDPEEIPQPQITISGSGVSIGDIYYKTEYENWKPGKKVRMEITVDAAQGKYFPVSLGRSKCRVTGADFVSAKALDNTSMQVKVNYTPVTVLGDTALAGWSSHDSEKAVWKKVDYAPGYTLTLYGNDKVVKRMTVTSNSVSLKEYMTDPDKIYYYQVKAVPVTAEQKKYLKEGEFITSKEQDVDDSEEEEKEKRAENLMDLQYEMMYQKHEQAIGERRLVVIDELSPDVPGLLLCRSQGEAPDVDPWILVYADEGHGYQPGEYLTVRLTGLDEYDFIGEIE